MCTELSAQIVRSQMESTEHAHYLSRQSAHKHVQSGLSEVKRPIQSLASRLWMHEARIDRQLVRMRRGGEAN